MRTSHTQHRQRQDQPNVARVEWTRLPVGEPVDTAESGYGVAVFDE
ncbi:hypothetical protein ACFYY8_37780 [Streptosporangium sp. NPDC001559]